MSTAKGDSGGRGLSKVRVCLMEVTWPSDQQVGGGRTPKSCDVSKLLAADAKCQLCLPRSEGKVGTDRRFVPDERLQAGVNFALFYALRQPPHPGSIK
jgi:hypothetical protein